MQNLTDRQKFILLSLTEAYVSSAQPVGSRALARARRISFSPATIRNEMSDLEELGYITHPHTSSGRVPTDRGYRFYVDHIREGDVVNEELAKLVMRSFSRKIRDLDELIAFGSEILSKLSEQVSIILYPEPELLIFKQAKVAPIDSRHVLLIWESTSGVQGHRLTETETPVNADLCRKITNLLNSELEGRKLTELEAVLLEKWVSRRDELKQVFELAKHIVEKSLRPLSPVLKLGGSDYIFEKPEFQDLKTLRRLLHHLQEEDQGLRSLVAHDASGGGIHVHIGEENPSGLQDCAVVTAPYTLSGTTVGSIAIVGPRRMPYRRVMSVVHYFSQSFSEYFDRIST